MSLSSLHPRILTVFPSQSVFGVPGDFNMRMYSPLSRFQGDADM